jgi:hypothetical protein
VQSTNDVTVSIAGNHGLNAGDNVFILFPSGGPPSGQYTILSVPDLTHFKIQVTSTGNFAANGQTVYPLVPAPSSRGGNVGVSWNTWAMNFTDTGANPSLSQTPLNSPTVFNFFFPGYRFPGALAAAGLTTPEFQLMSDTSVALQMNFFEGGILTNRPADNIAINANINGLSSFNSGSGAIVLDFGSWMTQGYTSNAGIPALVDALNSLLVAGQLSDSAKTQIINYVANVANFPYGSPPTSTQMRDRVRAVVYLIAASPDFITQN